MLFVGTRQQAEFGSGNLHEIAVAIVREIEFWVFDRSEVTISVTCVHRTPEENDALYGGKGTHLTGPHVLWHAVDLRSRDIPPLDISALLQHFNERWQYDRKRPALECVIHETTKDPGSSGEHLHIQVLPGATMLRMPVEGMAT